MATLLLVAAIVLGITYEVGWYQQVHRRFFEFQRVGSSANHRFIEPLAYLIDFAKQGSSIYEGIGPGNITKSLGYQWWPFTKASAEYGFITGVSFYVFFLYSIFASAPDRRVSFMFAIWFSFMCGFAVPLNACVILLFCTLFRIVGPDGLPIAAAPRGAKPTRPQAGQPRPIPPRKPIEA
jgi:hypothetical protein